MRRSVGSLSFFVLLAGAAACSEATTGVAPDPTVRITVNNYLVTSVTTTVSGVNYAPVASGSAAVFTAAASARILTWVPASTTYSDGSPIATELQSALVKLSGSDATVDVINVVGDQTFFMPLLVNTTGVTIDIAIYDGTQSRCLGFLKPLTAGAYYGYYLLRPGTEVRYYVGNSGCTGTYRYWDRTSVIIRIQPGSGLARFVADVAP